MKKSKNASNKKLGMRLLGLTAFSFLLGFIVNYNMTFLLNFSNWIIITVISQLLSMLLVAGICHGVLWDAGDSDRILVAGGHKKIDLLRGLKLGVFVYLPSFLLAVLLTAVWFSDISDETYKYVFIIFRFADSPIFTVLLNMTNKIMADGVVGREIAGLPVLLVMFLLPLVFLATSAGSYILGYKQINLVEKIIYKKKK